MSSSVVTLTALQTLTDKTITGTTNTVHASGFKSSVPSGVILSTTQPTTNQSIVASSSTFAAWADVVTPTATQTLTNKTITGTTNTVHASGFKTTAGGVVLSTTSPTAGQAIVASSGTAAAWGTVGNVITNSTTNPSRGDTGILTDGTTHAFVFPSYSRAWIRTDTNRMNWWRF
eukprot:TRINITY_DN5742_c0_g1_i2.p1 TRINITY_DN5742_c0_g1~~TRINITY_DN5742_c0_g1_i2.p1  ORF type:complete len:174 (-),score=24.30 TRINITY_DN5742_c0_g1_i2:87-608(-)